MSGNDVPVTAGTRLQPSAGIVVQGGVLAYLLLNVVATSVLFALGGAEAEREGPAATEQAVLANGIAFAVAIAFAFVWPRGFGLGRLRTVPRGLLLYLPFLVVWVPVCMIGVPALWRGLEWSIEPQRHLVYFVDRSIDVTLLLMLAPICVIGPIAEEVVFRGYLQTGLRRAWGPRSALVATSVVFGLVHVGSGWFLFVPMLLMGLFLGWVRDRSGGLAAPITIHIVHNCLSIGLAVLSPDLFSTIYDR